MRILVLLHAGLGDVLMAIPALRALDSSGKPSLSIDVLVKSQLEVEALSQFAWRSVDEVVSLRSIREGGTISLARFLRELRRRRYDCLLAIHGTAALRTAIFSAGTGARRRVGPQGWGWPLFHEAVGQQVGEHKSDYYLRFVTQPALAVRAAKPSGVIDPVSGPDTRQAEWTRWGKFVILAPGSGEYESHKRWPLGNYATLARRLLSEREDLQSIAVVGAIAEAHLVNAVVTDVSRVHSGKCHGVIGLPLPDLFSLYRAAECAIAGCSGSTHIAAAVRTPTVGIYGPTNPGFTGPNTDQLRVVRLGLECSPCYRPTFRQGCGNPICMTRVSVDAVLKATCETLDGAPYPPREWFATTNATAPDPAASPLVVKSHATI